MKNICERITFCVQVYQRHSNGVYPIDWNIFPVFCLAQTLFWHFYIFKWISASNSHLRHVSLMATSNHSVIEYTKKSRIVEMWRWFGFQLLEGFNGWINIFDLCPNSRIRILNCTSIIFVTCKTKEMTYNISWALISVDCVFCFVIII